MGPRTAFGLQVSTAGGLWDDWRALAASPLSPAAAAAARERIALDAAVSVSQPRLYELSLALDGRRRELVAGYVHNLTVRRSVYNLLEAANVKGIFNYVSFAFEFRRALDAPYASALALGAAWQLNKNLLLKARAGTREASATLALKTWWDPALTFCATATGDRVRRGVTLGFHVGIEKGGALDYQKAVEGYQDVAPHLRVRASQHLAHRMSRGVDPQPFLQQADGGGGAVTGEAARVAAVSIDQERLRRFL
jgi:hypothetical protein